MSFLAQRHRPLLAQEEPLLQQIQQYHQNQSGAQQLYRQNMAEQARQQAEYQRRLAADEVGVEPYSLFLGRQTEDPSAGFEFAPADFWPGSAAVKSAAGIIPFVIGSVKKKVGPFLQDTPATTNLLGSPERVLNKGFIYPDRPSARRGAYHSIRLTSAEKKILDETRVDGKPLSPGDFKAAREAILKYKREHHPKDGWQPYTINSVEQTQSGWKINPSQKGAGFDFHRDLSSGEEFHGVGRQQRVSQMGGYMANEVDAIFKRTDQNATRIKSAYHWYRKVRGRLRSDWGSLADVFGDVAAAMSPNTKLKQNLQYAEEATSMFARGEFDTQLAFLDQWLKGGNSIAKLPDQYIIRRPNGMKFGQNSRNAMMAMLGKFREVRAGTQPKMRRFGGNLTGTSNKATVDVFAGRTMQRLAGMVDDRHKRVIPELNAVEGAWIGSGLGKKPRVGLLGEGDQPFAIWRGNQSEGMPIRIGGAYGFGSDVFDDAAYKLNQRGYDFNPDDLQAVEWLNEKFIWEGQGFTPIDRSPMLDELLPEVERYRGGISATQTSRPTLATQDASRAILTRGFGNPGGNLTADPKVIAATAPTSAGYYGGASEISFDSQVIALPGWDSTPYIENLIEVAKRENQMDVVFSKVVVDDLGANARPGIEVMFDPDKIRGALPVLKKLLGGQAGYTIIPSNRFVPQGQGAGVSGVSGFYIQWVPEIEMRFDDALRAKLRADPDLIYEIRRQKTRELALLSDRADDIPGVVSSRQFWYDTQVFGKTKTGGFDDGGYTGRTSGSNQGSGRHHPISGGPRSSGPRQEINLAGELKRALTRIEGR